MRPPRRFLFDHSFDIKQTQIGYLALQLAFNVDTDYIDR
jgi:hypothetical protein